MSVNAKSLTLVFIHLGILCWGCFLLSYVVSSVSEPRNFGLIVGGILFFLFVYLTLHAFGVWRDARMTVIVCTALACVTAMTVAWRVYLKEYPNHTRPITAPLVITGQHP